MVISPRWRTRMHIFRALQFRTRFDGCENDACLSLPGCLFVWIKKKTNMIEKSVEIIDYSWFTSDVKTRITFFFFFFFPTFSFIKTCQKFPVMSPFIIFAKDKFKPKKKSKQHISSSSSSEFELYFCKELKKR